MPSSEVPGAEAFSVTVECRDAFFVVAATGELDVYTSPNLRQSLDSVLAEGAEKVVVDLTGLSFIDSSGLGVLVGTQKRIKELPRGSFAVVCHDGSTVRRLLTLTGLAHVLSVHDSLSAALLDTSEDPSRPERP